jgi:hypothetical protein
MVLEEQMIFISSQLNNMSSRHFDAARTPPTHKTHSRKTNTHTQGCHSPDTQANILMATNTLPLIHNLVFCTPLRICSDSSFCAREDFAMYLTSGELTTLKVCALGESLSLAPTRHWTHSQQLRERRGCLARVGRRKERLHPAIC